jgi:hypothetical protein
VDREDLVDAVSEHPARLPLDVDDVRAIGHPGEWQHDPVAACAHGHLGVIDGRAQAREVAGVLEGNDDLRSRRAIPALRRSVHQGALDVAPGPVAATASTTSPPAAAPIRSVRRRIR